jgi:hypothetical protein
METILAVLFVILAGVLFLAVKCWFRRCRGVLLQIGAPLSRTLTQ